MRENNTFDCIIILYGRLWQCMWILITEFMLCTRTLIHMWKVWGCRKEKKRKFFFLHMIAFGMMHTYMAQAAALQPTCTTQNMPESRNSELCACVSVVYVELIENSTKNNKIKYHGAYRSVYLLSIRPLIFAFQTNKQIVGKIKQRHYFVIVASHF